MADDRRLRPRLVAARWVAVLLAVAAALVMMGLIDLFTLLGWVNQAYVWEVPLEASWGSFFTFFLGGAYVWVSLLPRTPWPGLGLLAVCSGSLVVSALAGTDWRPLAVAAGVAASGLLLWVLLSLPVPVGSPVARPSPLPTALAVLGLPLWLPYILEAFARSRTGELGSVTQGIEHWPVQGAVGVAIVLASLAQAVWEPCRPLFRVSVSLSAVYIGMAQLAYPDRAGAMDSLAWGVGVTLWGLLVALAVVPAPRVAQPEGVSVLTRRQASVG